MVPKGNNGVHVIAPHRGTTVLAIVPHSGNIVRVMVPHGGTTAMVLYNHITVYIKASKYGNLGHMANYSIDLHPDLI